MDIFDKYDVLLRRRDGLLQVGADPFAVRMDRILSATEALINGRKTILAGTNNCGKTNVLDALRVFTHPAEMRRDRYAETDDVMVRITAGGPAWALQVRLAVRRTNAGRRPADRESSLLWPKRKRRSRGDQQDRRMFR